MTDDILAHRPVEEFLRYKFPEDGEDTPDVPMLGKLTFERLSSFNPQIAAMLVALMSEFVHGIITPCHEALQSEELLSHAQVMEVILFALNEEREFHGLPLIVYLPE